MPASLIDSVTAQLLDEDRQRLEKTAYPVITLSASFRDQVEKEYHLDDGRTIPDVVFSRAHYSMALAVAVAAWGNEKMLPEKAWLVDPTNYIQAGDWRKAILMEEVGRLMARSPIFNWMKQNLADKFLRGGALPITAAVLGPLMYLAENVKRPIISIHIETGNILAQAGKRVVQAVTDPQVRDDYLKCAEFKNIDFCVFDDRTKTDFLEKAAMMDKKVDPDRIHVTGSPIDPRVVAARKGKTANSWQTRGLHVILATGGLGTNKEELKKALEQLFPLVRRHHKPIKILYYAGTNSDHAEMVANLAKEYEIPIGKLTDESASLRVAYAEDLILSNMLLLKYGFPWADLVVTKPSGDMAYDSSAAGCALLFLSPWGEWERVISHIFIDKNMARTAELEQFARQVETLMMPEEGDSQKTAWISEAMRIAQAQTLDSLSGAKHILEVAHSPDLHQSFCIHNGKIPWWRSETVANIGL